MRRFRRFAALAAVAVLVLALTCVLAGCGGLNEEQQIGNLVFKVNKDWEKSSQGTASVYTDDKDNVLWIQPANLYEVMNDASSINYKEISPPVKGAEMAYEGEAEGTYGIYFGSGNDVFFAACTSKSMLNDVLKTAEIKN